MKIKIASLSLACVLSVLASPAMLADNTDNMNVNVNRNDVHAIAEPGSQLMKEEEQMMHDKRLSSMVGDDPNNYKLQDDAGSSKASAPKKVMHKKHVVTKKPAPCGCTKDTLKQKVKSDIVADEATK